MKMGLLLGGTAQEKRFQPPQNLWRCGRTLLANLRAVALATRLVPKVVGLNSP